MGPLGWQETMVIFVLALLVFGPKKLPELGKTIGKAMTEFRRASSELRSTWDREMAQLERENESLKEEAHKVSNEIAAAVPDTHDYTSYYDSGYEYGYGSESTSSSPAPDSSTVGASVTEGAESAVTAASNTGTEPAPAGTESTVTESTVTATTVTASVAEAPVSPGAVDSVNGEARA